MEAVSVDAGTSAFALESDVEGDSGRARSSESCERNKTKKGHFYSYASLYKSAKKRLELSVKRHLFSVFVNFEFEWQLWKGRDKWMY